MRLRLLVNALLAALAACVHILFLFALLNPSLVSGPGAAAGLAIALAPLYTMVIGLGTAGLFLLYGWFARSRLPRRWLHWRFWGGFFAFDSLGVVGIYALNARFYRHLLDPQALQRLLNAGTVVLGTALLVAAAVWIPPLARRRAARAAVVALVGGAWGMLAGLGTGRQAEPRPSTRIELEALASDRALRVVGIDGLSSELLLPLVSEGRLPAFARLMKEGSYGSLRPFPPGDEMTLWTTVFTGKKPHRHLVRGPLRYRLAGGREELVLAPRGVGFGVLRALRLVGSRPTSPAQRAARALWDILSAFHVESVFVGFPLTEGGSELPSVRFRQAGVAVLPGAGGSPGGIGSPGEARLPGGAGEQVQAGAAGEAWLERLTNPASEPLPAEDLILRQGLTSDLLTIEEVARSQDRRPAPQVLAYRLSGFHRVAHRFLRYYRPEDFGNVSAGALERYGESLQEYCRLLDGRLAQEMDALRGRGILLVVSPHGMAPVRLAGRVLRHLMGGAPLSGEHRSGPPGIFFLHGPGARAGRKVEGARLTDLLPTVLYLLGLPVARDLDGEPLAGALTAAFLEANPASSIPTYEGAPIREPGPEPFSEPEDEVPPLD